MCCSISTIDPAREKSSYKSWEQDRSRRNPDSGSVDSECPYSCCNPGIVPREEVLPNEVQTRQWKSENVIRDHIERLLLKDNSNARILFGEYNANLKLLERSLDIKIDTRGNELIISGGPEEVALANASLTEMYHLIEEGYPLHPERC